MAASTSVEDVWTSLQPTEAERRLDPRVVAASDDEVVVLWQQRGLDHAGNRFECPVLGLYRVRDGKLAPRPASAAHVTPAAGALAARQRRRPGRRPSQ